MKVPGICQKAADIRSSVIQFVPKCFKSQEMCDKDFDACSFVFVFDSVPDRYKTQERWDKTFSEDSFTLKYCLDEYKTQGICDKAVDNVLPTLRFVTGWFTISKVIENLYTVLFADDDIPIFMKILVISDFQVAKWLFLM